MPGPQSDQYKGPKGHMPIVPTWMEEGSDDLFQLRSRYAQLQADLAEAHANAQQNARVHLGRVNGKACYEIQQEIHRVGKRIRDLEHGSR